MQISDIKDLMAQFDASSLREFSYQTGADSLIFSKNDSKPAIVEPTAVVASQAPSEVAAPIEKPLSAEEVAPEAPVAEGDVVESPLVGVAYLSPAPDKPAFVSVGDHVTKGQTLLIIEAMKVMNEVPAPKDGVITEILVTNEEVVEFGKGLVRIK